VGDAGAKLLGGGGAAKSGIDAARQHFIGAQTTISSIRKFAGTNLPTLTVSLVFVKEFSGSYTNIITNSLKLCTPFEVGEEKITPPMQYSPSGKGKSSVIKGNCAEILIGKGGGFLKINYMLCNSFSYAQSKQVRDDGDPLYITCNYQFEAARALDWKELSEWFNFAS